MGGVTCIGQLRCRGATMVAIVCALCVAAVIGVFPASRVAAQGASCIARFEAADIDNPSFRVREGPGSVGFTVTRAYWNSDDGVHTMTCAQGSVDYETVPGSATPGEDYVPASGTLTFDSSSNDNASRGRADAEDAYFSIEILEDDDSGEETFQVRLFNPQGTISRAGPPATVTIVEGDSRPASAEAAPEDAAAAPAEALPEAEEEGPGDESSGGDASIPTTSDRSEGSRVADRAPTVQGVGVAEDPDDLASAKTTGSAGGWGAALIAGGLLGGLGVVGIAGRQRFRRP